MIGTEERATLNDVPEGFEPAKREGQSPVVDVLLDRSRNVGEGVAGVHPENQRIESVSRFRDNPLTC